MQVVLLVILAVLGCTTYEPGPVRPPQPALRSHEFRCVDFSSVEFYFTDSGAYASPETALFVWHTENYVWPTEKIHIAPAGISSLRVFEVPLIQMANDRWTQPAKDQWSQIQLDQPNVHRILALEIQLEPDAAARLHAALRLVHEEQVADLLHARQIGTLIGGVVVGESGDRWPPPKQPSPIWGVGLTEIDFTRAVNELAALLRCSPQF